MVNPKRWFTLTLACAADWLASACADFIHILAASVLDRLDAPAMGASGERFSEGAAAGAAAGAGAGADAGADDLGA